MANYYNRWMGDIQRDTGHLACAEMGAYDRLLDHYYSTEQALPGDIGACERIARAMSKDERKAVAAVLKQFFVLGCDGYRQKRADTEIEKLQAQRSAKQTNGKAGGRPRKNLAGSSDESETEPKNNLAETKQKPSRFPAANLAETYSESSPTPTPDNTSSVESGGVSDIPRPKVIPITPSHPPRDSFAMFRDWVPDVRFASMLTPAIAARGLAYFDELPEFVLHWMTQPETRGNQAFWERKFLRCLEANQRYREASLA